MKARAADLHETGRPFFLGDFAGEVLVECPSCRTCAVVRCKRGLDGTPRLACPNCALDKRGWPPPSGADLKCFAGRRCARCANPLSRVPTRFVARKRIVEALCPCGAASFEDWRPSIRFGSPVDPYFRLPLWLRTDVRGECVWAYNREHLAFLNAFLRTGIRLRAPNRNASLASRLPGWMKTAALRPHVLRAISRLARKDMRTLPHCYVAPPEWARRPTSR
jgi:hypothetical protein